MTAAAQPPPGRRRALFWPWALLWCALLAPLLLWGLPSRLQDPLLFGGESAWPAERYHADAAAQARAARQGGADTDLNPIAQRASVVHLTAEPADRAEILRRYRLYSRQPDEMITFMALQQMQPRQGDFDPKLYQYGGAYIYLVGALLGAGHLLGVVHLTGDVNHYLACPEDFARFFVAARLISLLSAAALLLAVFRLAARVSGRPAGWIAAALLATSPLFISGALEAKPHMASAALVAWTAIAAQAWTRRSSLRAAACCGCCSGLASGFVLTGVVAAAAWFAPVARLLIDPRAPRTAWSRSALLCAGLAAAVYALSNPYVIVNAIGDGAGLDSNLGNSWSMYSIGRPLAGLWRVCELLLISVGPAALILGALGSMLLVRRSASLLCVAGAMLTITALLGADKPAEFARFLLLPAAALCVGAASACVWLIKQVRPGAFETRAALLCGASLCCVHWTGLVGSVQAFAIDAYGEEARVAAARWIEAHAAPQDALALLQEPAPFSVPPADLAHRQLWLLPASPADGIPPALPRWLVFTADDAATHAGAWWQDRYALRARFGSEGWLANPISWANKPTYVFERVIDAPDDTQRDQAARGSP